MSKTDDLLKAFKSNLNNWTCAYCGSNSGQPAAIFRELKKLGYQFEELSSNRWANELYCEICKTHRTHYKLLKLEPVFDVKKRNCIGKNRSRILTLLDYRDAFTGASISSTPEIDHKTPWSRLDQDIDVTDMTDDQIKANFQLLTREHNLLKDRMCGKCIKTKTRPPFLEISYWYSGNGNYDGTCIGCGWFDGVAWRKSINEKICH